MTNEPERIILDHLAVDGTFITDDGDGKHRHWNAITDEYVATHDGDALDCRRALAAFGPGTTAGGRAEAGWHDVGRIAEDGIVFVSDLPADWPNSRTALTSGNEQA